MRDFRGCKDFTLVKMKALGSYRSTAASRAIRGLYACSPRAGGSEHLAVSSSSCSVNSMHTNELIFRWTHFQVQESLRVVALNPNLHQSKRNTENKCVSGYTQSSSKMTCIFADLYMSYGYVFKKSPYWQVVLVKQPCEERANQVISGAVKNRSRMTTK